MNMLARSLVVVVLGFWGLCPLGKAAADEKLVRIAVLSPQQRRAEWFYVITHGMGGTAADDRFHRLAESISRCSPQACVLRIDWSETASATSGNWPNPWKVAASIDRIGDLAARLLIEHQLDPARATLIGESFGNWVNARVARRLGNVQGILAFNPASEAGGYAPPDLRLHAQCSWSFHTHSAFDTTREIAAADFLLQTPAEATHWQRHVWGIAWLTLRLQDRDLAWLTFDKRLPARKSGRYTALAAADGQLGPEPPLRRPVELANSSDGRVSVHACLPPGAR
jgi:hypothetical protein